MTVERVFLIGGTGNIGVKCAQDLLDKEIPITIYTRNASKISSLFPSSELIRAIEGDHRDLEKLKTHLMGHTRLFLLIGDPQLVTQNIGEGIKLRTAIAQCAYEAGIKQIVNISAFMVNYGYRTSYIGASEYFVERAIYEEMGDRRSGTFVSLRPSRFMSNILRQADAVKNHQTIVFNIDADERFGMISTNDIGAIAAVVLSEDIEKHGDAVYNLTGQVVTYQHIANVISNILGKEIKYQQLSHLAFYKFLRARNNHLAALDFCDNLENDPCARVNPAIEILLERNPETIEEYLLANKHVFS